MIKTVFHQPIGQTVENISIKQMEKNIIEKFPRYWDEGSGDGYIEFFENDIKKSTLLIGPNETYGIYLQYIDNIDNTYWLSLRNRNKLDEVAETADEIYASIGLFLPVEKAWEGIKEFLNTGNRSAAITWVDPNIIPENGNW